MKKKLHIIAMIPARYEASRFPGKLMKDLGGKPVIVRTYEQTKNTGLFDETYVVTDSQLIYDCIDGIGGKVLLSQKKHECGSDRIAEAVANITTDIVINVQGDEPFTHKKDLEDLINVFYQEDADEIDLASLQTPISKIDEIENPNAVKVITTINNFAMYFSRAPIPYLRDEKAGVTYYKHKGIYAFKKQALLDFSKMEPSPLELAEKLEGNRFLEYGRKIKMVVSEAPSIGIDVPADLEKARKLVKE